jgi:hypothetical protein
MKEQLPNAFEVKAKAPAKKKTTASAEKKPTKSAAKKPAAKKKVVAKKN